MSSQSYYAFRDAMEAAANGREMDFSARYVHARTLRSDYLAGRLGALIERARRAIARRRLRRETIRELEMLDDRMLADIGISRDAIPEVADALARKAFARPETPPARMPVHTAPVAPRAPANDDAPRRAA